MLMRQISLLSHPPQLAEMIFFALSQSLSVFLELRRAHVVSRAIGDVISTIFAGHHFGNLLRFAPDTLTQRSGMARFSN